MGEILQREDGSFYDPDNLPIEVIPFENLCRMGVDLHIKRGRKFVSDLEWMNTDLGSLCPPAVIHLTYDNAQALMNRLWVQGFRPKPSLSGASQEPALKAHLEDMRQMAFSTLDIKKPG